MGKKRVKKPIDPTVLLNKLQTISHGLDGLSKALFHLDKLGCFAVGMYAEPIEASASQKLLGGISTVMALELAKASNLPASIFGVTSLTKTFGMAYTRSKVGQLKKAYEDIYGYSPEYKIGLQYPGQWGREYEEYWNE